MNSIFLKKIVTLVSGTAGSQLILLLITPILTRLYDPNDFGLFSVFVSISLIIGTVSCLRYDVVIPLPKRNYHAFSALVVGVGLAIILGVIVSIIVFVCLSFDKQVQSVFSINVDPNLSYLGIFAILYALNQALTFWKVRNGLYRDIAIIKLLQGVVTAVIQVALGYMLIGALGLVLGYLAGFFVSALMHLDKSSKAIKKYLSKSNKKSIIRIIRRYKSFAVLSTSSSLVNNLGLHMPILLLGYLYSYEVVGLLMLSNRMLGAPVNMVGQAIGNVYLGDAPSILRDSPEKLFEIFKDIIKKILIVGIVPCVVIMYFAPSMFSLFFGKEWYTSGEYLQLLAPAFFMQLIVSPLSLTLVVLERQKLQLVWDVFRLVVVFLSIVVVYYFGAEAKIAIAVYSISLFVLYLMLLIVIGLELRKKCVNLSRV